MKIHLKSGKDDQIRIHAIVPLTSVTMLRKTGKNLEKQTNRWTINKFEIKSNNINIQVTTAFFLPAVRCYIEVNIQGKAHLNFLVLKIKTLKLHTIFPYRILSGWRQLGY